MNVTLAPGASLRRVAEILRNAVLFGPDAWENGSLSEKNVNPMSANAPNSPSHLCSVFASRCQSCGLTRLISDPISDPS